MLSNNKIIHLTPRVFNESILTAKSTLENGGIIVYPTDTSYGIGTLWNNESGIRKILTLKNRPIEMGLPLLFGNISTVLRFAKLTDIEYQIVKQYWPGALTLIVNPTFELPLIQGSHKTIAVRIPQNLFLLRLLELLDAPLVGTSANISGKPSPHEVHDCVKYFGESIDLYIDDGKTIHSLDSTIIRVEHNRISVLRKGPVSISETIL